MNSATLHKRGHGDSAAAAAVWDGGHVVAQRSRPAVWRCVWQPCGTVWAITRVSTQQLCVTVGIGSRVSPCGHSVAPHSCRGTAQLCPVPTVALLSTAAMAPAL